MNPERYSESDDTPAWWRPVLDVEVTEEDERLFSDAQAIVRQTHQPWIGGIDSIFEKTSIGEAARSYKLARTVSDTIRQDTELTTDQLMDIVAINEMLYLQQKEAGAVIDNGKLGSDPYIRPGAVSAKWLFEQATELVQSDSAASRELAAQIASTSRFASPVALCAIKKACGNSVGTRSPTAYRAALLYYINEESLELDEDHSPMESQFTRDYAGAFYHESPARSHALVHDALQGLSVSAESDVRRRRLMFDAAYRLLATEQQKPSENTKERHSDYSPAIARQLQEQLAQAATIDMSSHTVYRYLEKAIQESGRGKYRSKVPLTFQGLSIATLISVANGLIDAENRALAKMSEPNRLESIPTDQGTDSTYGPAVMAISTILEGSLDRSWASLSDPDANSQAVYVAARAAAMRTQGLVEMQAEYIDRLSLQQSLGEQAVDKSRDGKVATERVKHHPGTRAELFRPGHGKIS